MLREASPWTTLVGFTVALVVLAAVVWVLGVDQLVAALTRADVQVLGLVLLAAAVWLASWALALQRVLGSLGGHVSGVVAVAVFAAATFANNVTPFGQAGGEPIAALFISRAADTEYETGLAAIASVDSLNFVPSMGLATVGLGYFAATIAFGRRLMLATVAVGLLAIAIPVAGYLAWRHRYRVEGGVIRVLTPVVRTVGRLVPRRSPPDTAAVERRIEGFFHAIERITNDRTSLGLALLFSGLGWVALGASLWLSLYALGSSVPFAAVLVVVPVAAIAGVTPLPGGLGGVETVLIALLVPTTGVPAATAGAAVLLHRTATYWLPMALGGGVASTIRS